MTFFHTAISVNNLEKSRAFYEAVFGLKFRSAGERSDLEIKFVSLEDGNGNAIELFQHKNPQPLGEDLMDFHKIGIKHIAFTVENIEKAIDEARAHGGKLIWPAKKGVTVKRTAFAADPDGIPVELVEL